MFQFEFLTCNAIALSAIFYIVRLIVKDQRQNAVNHSIAEAQARDFTHRSSQASW